MARTVKLIRGARTLDLTSGRYSVGTGFAPPATNLVPQMAGGTSANRTRGAVRVGLSATNRDWSFQVNIVNCQSPAEVTRALGDLSNFLALAGDESEPLYLFFKPDADIAATPTWGQSGYYYEIAHADVPQPDTRSTRHHTRGQGSPWALVNCQIKPYAQGRRQRVMSAVGGVLEDRIGTTDGQSRGLLVPPAASNFFTNPVLGHGTYTNGWTTGASLVVSQVTDPALLPGPDFRSAARITSSASTANTFTQALQVAASGTTHILSTYARLPSGCPVSSTHCQMVYNGSALTGCYVGVGNSYYRIAASLTSAAASPATGILVKQDYSVITTGFQLEQDTIPTPLAWGDLLGCAWAGTAHASTTFRTAARVRVPVTDILRAGQGTLRLVWKVGEKDFNFGTNFNPLQSDSTEFNLFYSQSDNLFYFRVHNVDATTTGQSFVQGDLLIFHLVWSEAGGLVMYINGASAATAAYAFPLLGTYLYLGSSTTPNQHSQGTLMGLDVWDTPASAAEVLADYNDVYQVAADDQRVSAIPWLWTKDGDDVVDNATDLTGSTGAPHDNFAVVSGIPGSAQARTAFWCTLNTAFDSLGAVWMSLLADDIFIKPANYLVAEVGGTSGAVTDAGGDYETASIDTSGGSFVSFTSSDLRVEKVMGGREVYLFARVYDAGSTLNLASIVALGSVSLQTDYISASQADTTPRLFKTLPVPLPAQSRLSSQFGLTPFSLTVHLLAKHTTGTANVRTDFMALMPRPLVKIAATLGDNIFAFDSSPINYLLSGTTATAPLTNITGDPIELVPGKINTLLTLLGNVGTTFTIANTLTYTRLDVTPRWGLL